MSEKSIIKKSESILSAKSIYIEEMSFSRNEHNGNMVRFNESALSKSVDMIDENLYKCSLELEMSSESEDAKLQVKVSGIFSIETLIDEDLKMVLVTKNTMAILFPYLRTQVTLLTAQPNVETVVLPPVNINALLENMK